MPKPQVDMNRIKKDLLDVGSIANSGTEGYTRLAFSEDEKKALNWLKKKMQGMDVSVKEDAIGNVFGRLGSDNAPAIAFGSHLDTVKNGGLYDGALGVVIALECMRILQEYGYNDQLPLELICFIGEEANPLGGTFGSRALAGHIKESDLSEALLAKHGFQFKDIQRSQKNSDDFLVFLELHIEQGDLLEKNADQVGIVTSIAGISRMNIHVRGRASHSGTTPMTSRSDALVDASKIVLEVNNQIKELNSDLVATVGKFDVSPNSENVVPGDVYLSVEIRGENWVNIKEFETSIKNWLDNNFNTRVTQGVQKYPSTLSTIVPNKIELACKQAFADYQYLISGANHDANSLTSITEVGMIFVPSKDGISHHPDEFTSWEDIEYGANTFLYTILELSDFFKENS